MVIVRKHKRRTNKGLTRVKSHQRKVRKRGKYYHPKGQIIIENRPTESGYSQISEKRIKQILDRVPKKDLGLIKRIKTKKISGDRQGYVALKKPREIVIGHRKKDEFIISDSMPMTLAHEIGHIASGHMTKENLKRYNKQGGAYFNMENEADNYARDIIFNKK